MTEEQLSKKKAREAGWKKQREAKKAKEDAIQEQLEELDAARRAKAQKRLKYLLCQSDIFRTHFGVSEEDLKTKEEVPNGPKKNGGKHRDDGKAEEEETSDSESSPTFLLKQPPSISGAMRGYQLEGLNWMINLQAQGINGILADEMGLGKTLQSISILGYLLDYQHISGPHIVIVPKSTLSNWMNEINRWCPKLRAVRFHGDKHERAEIVKETLKPGMRHEERSWDVCVTTYEVSNMESSALKKIPWRYLIIDEAHRLKNEESTFSQMVRMLNTQHRLLLTGTPLQNNLHELWALLNFLLPDVFNSSDQFNEFFNLDTDDDNAKENVIQQLHKILRPFMLRRLKVDVEKALLPKTETILFTGMTAVQKVVYCSCTHLILWQDVYKNVLMRNVDTVNGSDRSVQRTALLNIVMQLRKCCNHPYLFPGVEDRNQDPMGEHLIESCGKLRLLDKLLKRLKEKGHRVLVFSQMTKMLDILEDFLVMRGYLYCRIDGDTSYDQREDYIDSYNAKGSAKFVFLLSTRAGGLGINLQTADTVILYDSDWNPQADLQAQDRAHRIGQKKAVRVFRLVTERSVEEKVVERAQQKLKLDAMVVQSGDLSHKAKVGKNDLLEALRFGADKVFRSKESDITDEDIDAILARGEERTKEMESKLEKADKGDLLNFKMDTLTSQQFEGVDYSNKELRDAMRVSYIDMGKRERKPVQTGIPGITDAQGSAPRKVVGKLPRKLDLPKMHPWQLYDQEKLDEIQESLYLGFKGYQEELPTDPKEMELLLIGDEMAAEKEELLAEGFGSWSRNDYQAFLRGCAELGKDKLKEIAELVGKTQADVEAYSEAFWSRGHRHYSADEWERIGKQIEKGNKRREEEVRFTAACHELVGRFENPWEQLELRHAQASGKVFLPAEDRAMLCLSDRHGWKEWGKVKESLLDIPRFDFDYYLRSQPTDKIGRRCEHLMRQAEKDLQEMAAKQLADAEKESAATKAEATPPKKGKTDAKAGSKQKPSDKEQKLKELDTQLDAVNHRIKEVVSLTAQLETVLTAANGNGIILNLRLPPEPEKPKEKKKKRKAPPADTALAAAAEDATELPSLDGAAKKPRTGGSKAIPVPDELLPELCRLVENGGADSISALVDRFRENHPAYSKSMTQKRIKEIGVREAREAKVRWYLLDACRKYLSMPLHEGLLPAEQHHAARAKAKAQEGPSKKAPVKKAGGGSAPSPQEHPEPNTGFVVFCKLNSKAVRASMDANADPGEVMMRLTTMWKNLPQNQRQRFVDASYVKPPAPTKQIVNPKKDPPRQEAKKTAENHIEAQPNQAHKANHGAENGLAASAAEVGARGPDA
ncbi:unnamed protein product [Chrysoparadoxa australica]